MEMRADITEFKSEESGKRIDIIASAKTGISRSRIQKLIEKGLLLVNSKPVSRSYRVKKGDTIFLTSVKEEAPVLISEAIPLDILYKDEHLVVINKPHGMVVYPAAGHARGTLMNALSYLCGISALAAPGGPLRPGVVHRLDKDTSGVMVVALSSMAYYGLVEQFRQRTIKRRYIALVYGRLKKDRGEISLSIGRSESDRKKMSTKTRKSKEAVTEWRLLERLPGAALIEARLKTGRTHQIRVHFASVGHPVLGDRTYGKKTFLEIKGKGKIIFSRQMLHAETLGFVHPATGKLLEFRSPLPEDMERLIKEMHNSES